ncbi:ANTAR domain-containing response regulator [Microvirga sp. M2]|uniref:ANTAR domain-containing response regulator n=1 Tax=Microvirga sp. M2 TaxID=3073270 RepID=UPI0039C1DAC2
MTPHLIKNFRGMRVAVVHMPDRNRQIIVEILTRLGLVTTVIDPQDEPVDACSIAHSTDIVFFDADAPDCSFAVGAGGEMPIPTVAVLGLETPSRLERTLNLQPTALVYKPIRATGIYTAVFFAANQFRRFHELRVRLADLEARHGARRFVIKAIVALIEQYGIDDEQAYRILRRESMKRRLTVEEFSETLIAAGPSALRHDALAAR